MQKSFSLLLALLLGLVPASAKVRTPSDDDILQAACYPDVQRLCKDEIPDEKKITACMERHKSKISRKCTDAYEKVEKAKR